MRQHLRWSPEQLREHLIKRHGAQAAANHPALEALKKMGPSALEKALLSSDPKSAFVQASVRSCENEGKHPTKSVARNESVAHPMELTPDEKNSGKKKEKNPHAKRTTNGVTRSRPLMPAPKIINAPAFALPQVSTELTELQISRTNIDQRPVAPSHSEPLKITQRARSIESLKNARWSGSHAPGSHLEIRFQGVVLLSVNTLYGLSHFQRVKYRKTWHELVETAVASIVGGFDRRQAFSRYIIFAHRVSRRLADTDAKSGYLKYPIDGLRYAGILVEDTEEHFRDFLCTQAIGEPALILRIEAVDENYIPVAMRNPWTRSIHEEFSPPPKVIKPKKAKKTKENKRLLSCPI